MGLHRKLVGGYFRTKLGTIKETTYGLSKLRDTQGILIGLHSELFKGNLGRIF